MLYNILSVALCLCWIVLWEKSRDKNALNITIKGSTEKKENVNMKCFCLKTFFNWSQIFINFFINYELFQIIHNYKFLNKLNLKIKQHL